LTPWEPSLVVQSTFWIAVALYINGLVRARQVGIRAGFWKPLAFLLGAVLMYFVTQTRFDYYAQHMFFIHRAQHLVLHHLGPFLIALSAPSGILARGVPAAVKSRAASFRPLFAVLRTLYRAVQQPFIASVLFVGLIYFWLIPSIHFDAMLSADLYWLMNISMGFDGLLFWWLMLEHDPNAATPWIGYGRRIAWLFVVMIPQIYIGAHIFFAHHELYPVYAVCGRAWPISPLVDQQIGGLITWVPSAMMSVVGILILLRFVLAGARQEEGLASGNAGSTVAAAPQT